jgi:hypothetical protein
MSKEFINSVYERVKPTTFYIMDGYDDCIIGYDFTNGKLVYSETLILEQLTTSMSFDEALDYYAYNILDTYANRVIINSTLGE